MTIQVTVNPTNTAYPQTPQQVIAAAKQTYDGDVNSLAWRNRMIGREYTNQLLLPVAP